MADNPAVAFVDITYLEKLGSAAKTFELQEAFIDIAVEWARQANAEINRLKKILDNNDIRY